MIFLIVLLLLCIVILFYLVRLLNRKVEIYESFILERRDAYVNLLERLREIDSKEIFEKDDEVGVTFSDIKNEIEEFNKFIE